MQRGGSVEERGAHNSADQERHRDSDVVGVAENMPVCGASVISMNLNFGCSFQAAASSDTHPTHVHPCYTVGHCLLVC